MVQHVQVKHCLPSKGALGLSFLLAVGLICTCTLKCCDQGRCLQSCEVHGKVLQLRPGDLGAAQRSSGSAEALLRALVTLQVTVPFSRVRIEGAECSRDIALCGFGVFCLQTARCGAWGGHCVSKLQLFHFGAFKGKLKE